jgi:hypothetical protein
MKQLFTVIIEKVVVNSELRIRLSVESSIRCSLYVEWINKREDERQFVGIFAVMFISQY